MNRQFVKLNLSGATISGEGYGSGHCPTATLADQPDTALAERMVSYGRAAHQTKRGP